MSLNNIYSQKYLVDIEILSNLLTRFIERRKRAVTKEEQVLLEHEAILFFEKLLDLDFELQKVITGDYLSAQEIFGTYSDYEILLYVGLIKLRKLAEIFIKHYEVSNAQLTGLISKLKRAKQKKASLKLWNSDVSYALVESFLNLDFLDNKYCSEPLCTVHSGSGILTLPVKSKSLIPINKVLIGKDSNGVPGNSDIKVNDYSRVENILEANLGNWFEYERLDTGPLKCTLVLELASEAIVNNLRIIPIHLDESLAFTIEDITFSIGGVKSTSIFDLVGNQFEKETWEVRSLLTEGWSMPFTPIKAKTISVHLRQNQSYPIVINLGSTKQQRKRYSIGIKHIEVSRLTFLEKGEINSKNLELPGNLYLLEPDITSSLPDSDFYENVLTVSTNDGESWEKLDPTLVLEGTERGLTWHLSCKRNNEAIRQVTSLLPNTKLPSVRTILRSVSKVLSPYETVLPTKPYRNSVFALQTKVCKRGTALDRTLLGFGSGTEVRMPLPFIMNNLNLVDELHIYVNGIEYTYQADNTSLAANEYSISDTFDEIEFSEDLPLNARVEILLDEEVMSFEERADGYYHKMNFLFDPDKETIQILSLPTKALKASVILPRDQKVFRLGYTNILDDTFQLESQLGLSYTQVNSRALALATPNSYYVNFSKGIIWFNEAPDSDTIRVSFNHMSPVVSASSSYDIVYEDNGIIPWGIRIPLEEFRAINGSDTIGTSLGKIVNIGSGAYEERAVGLTADTNAKALTYNKIIPGSARIGSDLLNTDSQPEEIEFIDGVSEFYGLLHIEDEVTTAITASSDVVSFKLSAGSLWYADLGVHFSDTSVFGALTTSTPTSLGEYRIDNDGTVFVFIGEDNILPGDIEISYYYKNPDFDPANKYSINYDKGILYASKTMQTGTKISYKTASYKVKYTLGRALSFYSYNKSTNSVSIRTEELHPINNLVKICWLPGENNTTTLDLIDYFSPVISAINFRFY